jgi:hypothetical protein
MKPTGASKMRSTLSTIASGRKGARRVPCEALELADSNTGAGKRRNQPRSAGQRHQDCHRPVAPRRRRWLSARHGCHVSVTLHKFVPIAAVPGHLSAGWMATQAPRGTCHEQYSVHMVRLCACGPPGGSLDPSKAHQGGPRAAAPQ